MTPDRWKQVKRVLDAACAGDTELRTEVESLLASASAAHEFLETAGRPALLRPPAEGRPEARAGASAARPHSSSSVASGASPSIRSLKIFRIDISGTARRAPGMPHAHHQNVRAANSITALSVNCRPITKGTRM